MKHVNSACVYPASPHLHTEIQDQTKSLENVLEKTAQRPLFYAQLRCGVNLQEVQKNLKH